MEVCPFRGIRYNEEIVGDLAQVICPPYDIITSEEQKLYYEKSEYNAIRLEYPVNVNYDRSEAISDDKYNRAATTLQQWLKQGILQVDRVSSFYLHDHYFDYLGEKRVRRGLIARVKLEPWGNGVYPHEETYSKAKDDRLQLMRACHTNFSPLLSLYQDTEQKVASILAEASQAKPIIDISVPSCPPRDKVGGWGFPLAGGQGREKHIVWAITDPKFQQQIKRSLAAQWVYMADGHHRYETALAYQQERACPSPDKKVGGQGHPPSGKEAFNYIMMELVDFSDPGLIVLPIHRLVRGISPSVLAKLKSQLEDFFILKSVPLAEDAFTPCKQSEVISKMANEAVLAVLGLEPGYSVLLKRRQDTLLEAMMPGNRSQAYREFNVSLLNHVILDKMLSLTLSSEDIAYTVNPAEAYQQIREGKYQLAFLLSPPRLETVKAVAEAKDRMPCKSTYFYPKPPAGLIINSLD